jgi:hypothetical protein
MQDPVEGKIALTLGFKTVYIWPSIMPEAGYDQTTLGAGNDTMMQYFKIQWSVFCNGNTRTCDSTAPCDMIMDCSTEIGAINGWSSAMYPFDQVRLCLCGVW